MRIKFNDKIYRLKEIESGVDSLMELVEEPKFKDGDFLHSDWGDENITIICRKINGNDIYYHVSKSNGLGLDFDRYRYWPNYVDFRLATEEEKQKMLDALAKKGKRWNAEKKCIEDMPKRKFKAGDKVTLKSGCTSNPNLTYYSSFDKYIGKELIVIDYSGSENVKCNNGFYFHEDWLEPWRDESKNCDEPKKGDELKEGDLAIFWDSDKAHAFIGKYNGVLVNKEHYPHQDNRGLIWANAIKFESREQYEKLLKGEI